MSEARASRAAVGLPEVARVLCRVTGLLGWVGALAAFASYDWSAFGLALIASALAFGLLGRGARRG